MVIFIKLQTSSPASSSVASPCDSTKSRTSEKDKSSKRKSNLNRSLNSEEVPPDLSDDPKNRRRRRRIVPTDTSSNEDKTSLTATTQSPMSSPITASTSVRSAPRKSELSVHMENARKSVTNNSDQPKSSKNPSPRRKSLSSSPKEKSPDVDVDKEQKSKRKISVKKVENGGGGRISRRMDELTALTKETLARVERLANKARDSPKPKKKAAEAAVDVAQPVSILKRKVSQDETKSTTSTATPPVTFSPSVVEPATTNRKQGILKKRRSLDESQVLRHRSCSPDVAGKSDAKSILKNQRRSSLEEITRLSDTGMQGIVGILKHKPSKPDEDLDNSLNSPQSILKRRSGASSAGSSSGTHHHVSIATAVILAAAEGAEMILDSGNSETVRPILKKKSFSEEGDSDNLKPILKKKSSTDTDDGTEDKPMRPILKITRTDSYHSANESGSECEVRPILKTTETPRPRLSFCGDEEAGPPNDEDEDVAFGRRRARRSFGDEEPRSRVASVSELVMNFEKSTGAIPKRSSVKRNDRCRTQPITFNEFEASLNYVQTPQRDDFSRLALSSPSSNSHVKSLLDLSSDKDASLTGYFSPSLPQNCDVSSGGKMSSDSAFQSLGDGLELENEEVRRTPTKLELQMKAIAEEAKNLKLSKVNNGIQKYKKTSSNNYSRFSTQPVTLDEVQEAARINQEDSTTAEPAVDEMDPSKLSLSERIKLFSSRQAEQKSEKLEVPRRRTRFSTQPITSDEVETARFLNDTPTQFALDGDSVKGILKSSEDFPRGKSRSPPPKRSILKDFTYDEGISSNDSDTDSEAKIASSSGKSGSEQTSDESSSGGREIQSIIGTKRRQLRERSNDGNIVKSKSHSTLEGDDTSPARLPVVGIWRSNTTSAMRRSICELQAKLQQSGDSDWRKRTPKLNNASEELNLLNVKNLYNEELSEKTSILKAKKDELDASAKLWKNRVEKKDAESFSVAGRMQIKDIPSITINIPTRDKIRRTPKAKRFKGKEDDNRDANSTPVSPEFDNGDVAFNRSVSVPANSTDDSSGSDGCLRSSGRKVTVVRPDDETFKSFFKSVDSKRTEERIDVSLDDFDSVTRNVEGLLVQKRDVKVNRRKGASRNPLKTLAARSDIRNEYTEIITGVAERETKRLNIEKLARNSNLAVEALAGLASKEDFASVALKKSSAPNISYLPFKDLMLLHVKGRRHVQTRLVEPSSASINQGDNYILITPNALYNYVGAYSNVIEQSRAADVLNHIQQTGDMGCKAEQVVTINPKKGTATKDSDSFWKLLGSDPGAEVTGAGHPDEDEVYESTIVDTNMIYAVENDELVPVEKYWGALPKIEMLESSKVYVFDFGSEMYVWSGKIANPQEKKVALKLAKELWENGYNYTECSVCPLNVAKMLGDRSKQSEKLRGESRPEWSLFAKITQHRETVLFREKFLDWPDYSRVIRVREKRERTSSHGFDIKPCDISALDGGKDAEPDFEVDGSHLGRGRSYFDEETKRNFEINTLNVTCWVILENTYERLEDESLGHFYDGESYIVRWQFRVTVTGRELSGKPSKHCQLGRDRCIYFCWLGKNASTNEKGAAALLTVELDSENARQIRITQGSESPAFLQLFDGKMFVHRGKRDAEKPEQRLYICRGEHEQETSLLEVPCSMRSLRSRAAFVLVENDSITVWNGSKCMERSRSVARTLAEYVRSNKPTDFNFGSGDVTLKVCEEGEEGGSFLGVLGDKRQLYHSLSDCPENYETTPRMFYFSSISGSFEATEVLCPYRSRYTTPYPFLQMNLYSANQPALFLFDNGHELWLWQGWWPDVTDKSESFSENNSDLSEQTGSGAVRWQSERRAAMQTAVDYWRSKNTADSKQQIPAYLVWAGLEPLAFTNLFPVWYEHEDVTELNIKEGRKAGDQVPIEKELALLTRTTYPLAELLQRPLPDGVDPTHLEIYLSPEDFVTLLSITKEEFQKLPAWKQTALKKEKGLF